MLDPLTHFQCWVEVLEAGLHGDVGVVGRGQGNFVDSTLLGVQTDVLQIVLERWVKDFKNRHESSVFG